MAGCRGTRVGRFIRYTFGRRGGFLFGLGFIWLFIGAGVTAVPKMPHLMLHQMIPVPISVALWVGTGAIAMIAAFTKRDVWGFTALCLMPAVRCVSFTVAWLTYLAFGGDDGMRIGWTSAIVWAVIIGAIMLVASWPEPAEETALHPAPDRAR